MLAVGVFPLAGSGLHCGAFPAPLSGRFWHRGSLVSGLLSESSFFPRWSSPPSDATALGTGSPGLQGAFLFVSLGFDGIQKMPLLECGSCSPSLTLTHVVRWGWGGSCRWGSLLFLLASDGEPACCSIPFLALGPSGVCLPVCSCADALLPGSLHAAFLQGQVPPPPGALRTSPPAPRLPVPCPLPQPKLQDVRGASLVFPPLPRHTACLVGV